MKFVFITILLACLAFISTAQQIRPYLIIAQTTTGKQKGVLYKVDSAGLAIDGRNGFASIKSDEIKSIKVRAVKKDYKVKKFVKYDPWNERQFESNANGVPTRKWGEKDPTVKEEINGHIGTSLVNVLVNVIAAPIHAINPGIARMKFNRKKEFADGIQTLRYYSIYYQANPDELGELKKLKSLGK